MDISAIAATATPEMLQGLSDEELFALATGVEKELGREIIKQGERETAIENQLRRELDDDFRSDLDPAIEGVLAALPLTAIQPDEANAAVDEVTRVMSERDTLVALEIVTGAMVAFARIARNGTRRLLRTIHPEVEIGASLAQADLAALDALAGHQVFWIGESWESHLSFRIKATVAEEGVAAGLGRAQVGEIMKGMVDGTFPGVAVPKTFKGSTEQYFRMLAGTVRNQATNFGAVRALGEAGIQSYRVVAVLDERTSKICNFMHDRVFTVRQGNAHIDRILAASDPQQVKEIGNWLSVSEAENVAGEGSREDQNVNLGNNGLALPPYHGKCRTVVIPE